MVSPKRGNASFQRGMVRTATSSKAKKQSERLDLTVKDATVKRRDDGSFDEFPAHGVEEAGADLVARHSRNPRGLTSYKTHRRTERRGIGHVHAQGRHRISPRRRATASPVTR